MVKKKAETFEEIKRSSVEQRGQGHAPDWLRFIELPSSFNLQTQSVSRHNFHSLEELVRVNIASLREEH